MRIARRGVVTEVAIAADVSVVAALPCAVGDPQSTVGRSMHGDPSEENTRSLFQDVRSQQNIFSAWRHVKRSALSSARKEIRGAASEFEHSHQRHLHRIIAQLREGRFIFDPVIGVLKDAKKREAEGKMPRPIAIATLKNRIVQRAILQVLQPRTITRFNGEQAAYTTRLDARLGRINEVNRSRYGVGGLIYPYGGVQSAISTIRAAIDGGANYFYQSDIKAFFTKIPTVAVVEFVTCGNQRRRFSRSFCRSVGSSGSTIRMN